MEYNFREIEQKWRSNWQKAETYKVKENTDKPKYYVLDMFPYPSGAGLHVGHPLGYIASDILARYKRHKGFNVLHPMGYDSFGLPAEQYAIQTGQHPAITTEENINRYREQLDRIGFSYDWSREVRTSNPDYYKWTQWIFKKFFNSWYNKETDKAEDIADLIAKFEENGTYGVNAAIERDWYKSLDAGKFHFGEYFAGEFTNTDWKSLNEEQKELILAHYRLAYISDTWVNWCEALRTVLANDEVKDGLSERGGHPVEQKLMKQWSLRITAYADRLLRDLDEVDWSDAVKEMQRNWIGKSSGASVFFEIENSNEKVEVFTTRPDTIFGATFLVLAPEHALVKKITTTENAKEVEEYIKAASLKSERDRQSEVKNVTGCFTGAFAMHPFTGEKIPIWIGDYVLAGYGTGAVMSVPCGDQRDYTFAKHFNIPIKNIFKNVDISKGAYSAKEGEIDNSGFLTGLSVKKATVEAIKEIEKMQIGWGKINYRLRDAIFSRQRYWGEPFPVYYKNEIPHMIPDENLPVTLPQVDKYLPTEDGEPPLARAGKEDWNVFMGDHMEYNTMPGWAGSSWYFLRYMDPGNNNEPVSKEKAAYWNQVDFYLGGAEHATGHLLYARFWTKFLYDRGVIPFNEPFKKMINQGMILGKSSILYRDSENSNMYVSADKLGEYINAYPSKKGKTVENRFQHLRININLVQNDVLDKDALKDWQPEFESADFYPSTGKFICGTEVEKMSKRWHNVVDPEELCDKFGADTFRMYEMFLGPLEQYKPWDTQGINGVHNFLRKLWRLFHDQENKVIVSDEKATAEELKILHKTIKKCSEDLERFSFNTVVSALMICVNELSAVKCNKREILNPLCILLSPYAPHIAEELWEQAGNKNSVTDAEWPEFKEEFIKENAFEYPVSFNGKMRFKLSLPADFSKEKIEKAVMEQQETARYLEGKQPKKVIVVPGRIINIVV